MKLYGCFVLCILVLTVRASYFLDTDDDDDSQEDLYVRAYNKKQLNARKRADDGDSEVDIATTTQAPTTTAIVIQDPIRIAVFNSGSYDATIKLNYILDDKQAEQELKSSMVNMQERDLFIPRIATNIRIRVGQVGLISKENIIDWQVYSLKDTYDVCFLIAGTSSNPVYGTCGLPFDEMFKAWIE